MSKKNKPGYIAKEAKRKERREARIVEAKAWLDSIDEQTEQKAREIFLKYEARSLASIAEELGAPSAEAVFSLMFQILTKAKKNVQ
jgi:hypothetical protein